VSRVVQPLGARGSLKWIQRCVNAGVLDAELLPNLSGATLINWTSPLEVDGFAEYRDADFLARVGLERLAPALADFWPARGPQWDALALSDHGDVLLIEAKAHLPELFSPASAAGSASRAKIITALAQTAAAIGAKPKAEWVETFYQYANRIAHLHFLHRQGVSVKLVLVNFVGDAEMGGPLDAGEWKAAYRVVNYVMGISESAPLMRRVIHIYPDVRNL
jgi:hypothetical protein